jgi:hypothetical protein
MKTIVVDENLEKARAQAVEIGGTYAGRAAALAGRHLMLNAQGRRSGLKPAIRVLESQDDVVELDRENGVSVLTSSFMEAARTPGGWYYLIYNSEAHGDPEGAMVREWTAGPRNVVLQGSGGGIRPAERILRLDETSVVRRMAMDEPRTGVLVGSARSASADPEETWAPLEGVLLDDGPYGLEADLGDDFRLYSSAVEMGKLRVPDHPDFVTIGVFPLGGPGPDRAVFPPMQAQWKLVTGPLNALAGEAQGLAVERIELDARKVRTALDALKRITKGVL